MGITKVRANQVSGIFGFPKPYFKDMIPAYAVPSANNVSVTLNGSFFTPNTTISIPGQTVTAVNFISMSEINFKVTAGATEGNFDLIINNNGLITTIPGAFTVVLGDVTIPDANDWTNVSNLNVSGGSTVRIPSITSVNSPGTANWNIPLNPAVNWAVRWSGVVSEFGEPTVNNYTRRNLIIKKISDDTDIFGFSLYNQNAVSVKPIVYSPVGAEIVGPNMVSETRKKWFENNSDVFEFRWYEGVMYFYLNTTIVKTFTEPIQDSAYIHLRLSQFNFRNIKYIELA